MPLAAFWGKTAHGKDENARAAALAHVCAFIPLLSPPDAEAFVLQQLEADLKHGAGDLAMLPAYLRRPWSVEFGHKYLSLVRDVMKSSGDQMRFRWASVLPNAGVSLPRELLAAALAPWQVKEATEQYIGPHIGQFIQRFTETIQMRQAFYEQIGP
jgi:hypothetical protein